MKRPRVGGLEEEQVPCCAFALNAFLLSFILVFIQVNRARDDISVDQTY